MGLMTFKGGVHPHDGKEFSKDKPIRELLPKSELVFPVSQHIGAPASPVVAVGDTVLRGQKIAEAGGFVSAPIYSSVSGKVKAIQPRRGAVGDMVNSIIIENDEKMEEVEYKPVEDVTSLSKEEIITKVKEAGVVGMGGAGFPTHVKLSPKEPNKIEYIIANCAECEPYLTADYRRMLENPKELIEGMRIVLQLFDHAKGLFGIEDNKPDCIAKMQELTKNEPRMEVCPLKTKYPQGGERQLIYATTNREINSTMLPADAGCIVDNVETLISIYNAVKLGKPVMNRIFTVTGDAVAEPGNFDICLGMSYAEVLEAAGGFKVQPQKVISGGPMMGFSMFGLDIPTTKTSSSLLCLAKDDVAASETTACINCGRCVGACPEQIIPTRLAKMAEHGDMAGFEKWNGMECIECGSCSYICPAKIPLAQSIRTMKKQILAERRKQPAKKIEKTVSENKEQVRECNFLQKCLSYFSGIITKPNTVGTKMMEEADIKMTLLFIVLQVISVGIFSLSAFFKIFSSIQSLYDNTDLGDLLEISDGIVMPYGRIILLTIVFSGILTCILAFLIMSGYHLLGNKQSFTQILSMIAVRSVILVPVSFVSALVLQLNMSAGIFVFFAGSLWAIFAMMLSMNTFCMENEKNSFVLMISIVIVCFLVIMIYGSLKIFPYYLPDTLIALWEKIGDFISNPGELLNEIIGANMNNLF